MARERKTVDVWEIWLNYGQGCECDCIETSRADMKENRAAYRQAGFSPRIRKRRVRRDHLQNHDPKRP